MSCIHIDVSVPSQTRWTNWSGSAAARPQRVQAPTSRAEIAELVVSAATDSRRVKVVGAGHSFTAIASAPDTQVLLDDFRPEPTVAADSGDVTVAAGTRLAQLNTLLACHKRAMPNLGDIDAQTLAGAIATGTHGTGARLGSLSTFVSGLRLIDGTGRERHYRRGDPGFGAVALGLGALGVVTDITVRTVPAFQLHADERPMALSEVVSAFDTLGAENDHVEFYWFPGADRVLVKRNNRRGAGKPLSRTRAWFDDEFMSNTVFNAACRLARAAPATVGAVTALSARGMSQRTYMDESFRVMCTPRRVRFTEMEYALPVEAFAEAFAALREVVARHRVVFPIEVRLAAADDLWLSAAHGRDSVYFAVHQYRGMPHRDYFADVEAVMRHYDGRPHWGKMHGRTAADLEPAYPKFADFLRLRDELDPQRVFANPYLDRVLG